jgi:hypothetical protein
MWPAKENCTPTLRKPSRSSRDNQTVLKRKSSSSQSLSARSKAWFGMLSTHLERAATEGSRTCKAEPYRQQTEQDHDNVRTYAHTRTPGVTG